MINIYMRQAWTLIKRNKLYSSIYIIGTSLSIALIMMVFIIYYIKFAPIYPEYNRNNTLVFKYICKESNNGDQSSSSISYLLCTNILGKMKNIDDIAITDRLNDSGSTNLISMPKDKDDIPVIIRHTNGGFWNVFTFNFVCGKPYTDADLEAHNHNAVICESLAKKIFGSADVAGRNFTLNGDIYKICGVVEDVSAATKDTYSEVWTMIPEDAMKSDGDDNLFGSYSCYMTVSDKNKKGTAKKEIQAYFDHFNHSQKDYKLQIYSQPDDYWVSTFRRWSNEGPDMKNIVTDFLIMMFAMLFVPALNLCGLISSRMENRLCEMGIRKAFGAKRKTLLSQIVWENLVLTAIGAVVGLILSYLVVVSASNWILNIFSGSNIIETHITFNMLFNPTIIGIAIIVCLILNIISAVIPALLSLRHNIIYSLNTKR